MLTTQPGHLYRYGRDMRVLALHASDREVRVLVLDPDAYMGATRVCTVQARFLTPLPMRYFKGDIPK